MPEPRKADGGKARMDLIPPDELLELGSVFAIGAAKYGDDNWRDGDGLEWKRLYAAVQRHLNQFWAGEDYDAEDGQPHLMAAAWACFTLRWLSKNRTHMDARRQPERVEDDPSDEPVADPALADVSRDALVALVPRAQSIWSLGPKRKQQIKVVGGRWDGEGWLVRFVDETGKPLVIPLWRFMRVALFVRDPERDDDGEESTKEPLDAFEKSATVIAPPCVSGTMTPHMRAWVEERLAVMAARASGKPFEPLDAEAKARVPLNVLMSQRGLTRLARFVGHREDCQGFRGDPNQPCKCGLDDVIKELRDA